MSDAFRVVGAFLRRDWQTRRTYRFAFAFDLFHIGADVFFYFLMSRLVDRGGLEADLGAESYLAFVLVGVILSNLALPGLYAFTTGLRDEQVNGSLEVMLATPARPLAVLLATGAPAFTRGVLTALLYVVLGMILVWGDLRTSPLSFLAALAACVFTTAIFLAAGAVAATVTLVLKRGGAGVAGLAGTVLGLLAGTYVPLSVYPEWLRVVAKLVPLTWGLEAARAGLLADRVAVWQLLGLLLVTAGSVPFALAALRWGLARSRHDGSLGQF